MSNDFLYWFGFYVEYRLLCLARGLAAFTRWFVRVLGALLTAVLRPVALGCIQLRQALRRPKAWLGLVVPLAGVLAFAWLVRTWRSDGGKPLCRWIPGSTRRCAWR